MLSTMTSNDAARVDVSAAASKPRRRRKPQQASHDVLDLVQSALAAKQREEERALAAQTRRHRKRAFRKPKGLKQHLQVAGGAASEEDTSICEVPDARNTSSVNGIANDCGGGAVVVVLENLMDPEELEDSDEYDDVVADLERDFQSYGDLISLQILRETGVVTLQLANSDVAHALVHEKHGKLFGGRQVVARLVIQSEEEGEAHPVAVSPPSSYLRTSPYEEAETRTQDVNADPVVQKKKKKRRSKCKSAVLREREKIKNKLNTNVAVGEAAHCKFQVCNLVTSDEIEDEDEFEELQGDTRADFEKFGALTHLEVVRRDDDSVVADNPRQQDPTTTAARSRSPIASPGDVVVEYADRECAAAAFRAYNGRVFGGRVVECQWVLCHLSAAAASGSTTSILAANMLSPEELEDPDEYEDIREEVAGIFESLGTVKSLEICGTSGEITVAYESLEAAQQAVTKLNQSAYGGRSVEVTLLVSGGDDGDDKESQKAEPDVTPDRPFVERAHQQNPLQDKRSRRLVLGLHEMRRGLLSKKIRLLVVGTDIEKCGVLDEKLSEILAIAKQDQVPVIFPMTRRKLGQVLRKNVRVSCVGVYSFEGANELFAEIIRNVSASASTES